MLLTSKFFWAFTVIPLVELFILIYMSNIIGTLTTVLIVVLTAILGTMLIKRTGREVMENLKKAMNFQGDLSDAILDGAILLVSGVLLITPGFFTDIFGLLIHVPVFKGVIKKIILKKFNAYMQSGNIRFESGGFGDFVYYENQENDDFEGTTVEVNQDDYYLE